MIEIWGITYCLKWIVILVLQATTQATGNKKAYKH